MVMEGVRSIKRELDRRVSYPVLKFVRLLIQLTAVQAVQML